MARLVVALERRGRLHRLCGLLLASLVRRLGLTGFAVLLMWRGWLLVAVRAALLTALALAKATWRIAEKTRLKAALWGLLLLL